MVRVISTAVVLTVVLVLMSVPLVAQNTSGSITGVVQDATGAVIPGAQVTLINQEQGAEARQTITNEAGIYLFSALPAATYTVTVELPGFKTYKKTDVKLFVNDRMGLHPLSSKSDRNRNRSQWRPRPSHWKPLLRNAQVL